MANFLAEDFDSKAYVQSRMDAGQDAELEQEFQPPGGGNAYGAALSPFVMWMKNLPKNVGVGVLDAALASAEFVEDATELAAPEGGGEAGSATPKRGNPDVLGNEPLSAVDLGAFDAVRQFRDHLAEGSNTGDQITQGLAQFAIPFTGWAKAFGGIKRAHSTARNLLTAAGAETATSAVNLLPDTGRFADLVELGRHTEGKLGDVLRTLTPDGSLQNGYINYISEREDDGPWEGRFKNVVDSLVTSGAVGGLIKLGAQSVKQGRRIFNEFADAGHGQESPVVFKPDDADVVTYERVTDALLNRVQQVFAESSGSAKVAKKPLSMADVVADLDKSIPADDPYRVVVDKLVKQELQGKVHFLSSKEWKEKHPRGEHTVGGVSFTKAFKENDEIFLNMDHLMKFKKHTRAVVGYTALHELVHAGTVRNLRRNPDLKADFAELSTQMKEAVPDGPKYGHTNANEFVAEAFSNLDFQRSMKKAGTWEPFIKKIGAIFGISGAALVQLESLIQQQPQEKSNRA